MTDNRIESILQARQAVKIAENRLQAAIRYEFPVGSTVRWKRGKNIAQGVVTLHGYGDTICVRNKKTNCIVRIGSYEIVEAYLAQDD